MCKEWIETHESELQRVGDGSCNNYNDKNPAFASKEKRGKRKKGLILLTLM